MLYIHKNKLIITYPTDETIQNAIQASLIRLITTFLEGKPNNSPKYKAGILSFNSEVGSSGNGRASLAPLEDADFQMWYWHLRLNLLLMVQKKTDTFQHGRAGGYSLVVGE